MKTLRDTNNNNSNTTNTSSSSPSVNQRHHLLTSNELSHQQHSNLDTPSYPSLLTSNGRPLATSSKVTTSNPNFSQLNPLASLLNGDPNHLSSIIQTYLTRITGNPLLQPDAINPLIYFQLMNTNAWFMQQISALQTLNSLTDSSANVSHSERKCQSLPGDSTIYVPKTRPMTQEEIAEHARLVYQRALQRNQIQQHHDLMKHFYETLNLKQQVSSNTTHESPSSIEQNDVPTVPNVSNIASIGTFDVLDTMVTSASSNLSMKEPSINAAASSFSLVSVDDSKMSSSVLDPGAPVFIPRQSRQKLDDENETSSSSSDSDFNDFHYLDQFLEEFYQGDHRHDDHLIISKLSSSNSSIIDNETSKYHIHSHVLGQGDGTEQKSNGTSNPIMEQPLSNSEQKPTACQYSISQLLDRYRNPRCHLVLPEWSRLSLILPNVCSMRAHTYKIKRYFAYRRRLSEDPNLVNLPIQS